MKKFVVVVLLLCAVSAHAQLIPYVSSDNAVGNGAPCLEAVASPNGIFGSSIGVLFADVMSGQIRWCGTTGTARKITQLSSTPIGVVRNDATSITYATTDAGALIAIDTNGNQTVLNVAGLQKPTQLSIGDGALWVADRTANAVWKVTLPCAGSCVAEKVIDATWLNGPQGVLWSAGVVYASDTIGGRVVKRSASGVILIVTSATNPGALAIDSAGALYFAEPTRVQRFSAGGSLSTFAVVNSVGGLSVKTMALPGQVSAHEYLFIGSLTDARIYAKDVAAVGPTATATETLAPTRTSTATSVPTVTASATKLPTCRSTPTPQTDCS